MSERWKESSEVKVGTRPTPLPPPFTRRVKEGSRDELTLEPPSDPSSDSPDSEVFERATAIPISPAEGTGLELDFSSLPPARSAQPPSNPFELGSIPPLVSLPPTFDTSPNRAGTVPAGPGRLPADAVPTLSPEPASDPGSLSGRGRVSDPADRSDRKRTVPEPMVERSIARVESVAPRTASERRIPVLEPPDPLDELSSPLGMVEAYRGMAQSDPHIPVGRREAGGSVSPEAPSTTVVPDMQDRYAVGDFTGALVVAESILDTNPEDEDAKRYAQSCREVLTQMYAARIGPMDQIAVVAVPPDQITWLSLDHRAGFLLSLVDGVSSIEEILDISGMTRLDALRIMYTLVQQNVITRHH
jgi:hypothetical protein